LVNVPASTAYNQWTQFEDFPQFTGEIKSVRQLSDDQPEWVAEIAGVRRQWEARIIEQVPDRKVAWAATTGATNAGAVTFEDVGGGQKDFHALVPGVRTRRALEKVGDKLNVVENQAEGDLDRFKAFIESERYATGAWRGSVNEGAAAGTTTADDAASSRGDSGKAGVSGAAAAAGAGVGAAVGGAVAAGLAGKKGGDEDRYETAETDSWLDVGTPWRPCRKHLSWPLQVSLMSYRRPSLASLPASTTTARRRTSSAYRAETRTSADCRPSPAGADVTT
jgi:hypothetical protein